MGLRMVLGTALIALGASGACAEEYVKVEGPGTIDEVPSCIVEENAIGIRPQLLDVHPQLLRVSFPLMEKRHLSRLRYRNTWIHP